ncbi:MAG TPA: septal ring lytic transglycosylase RlpA family protein [Candidatus Sulfotelmatobacter sp.]|jgi:rare lipoprotein A|nr:septal ring lytic transglycosylase RlpA family protein [Candidatus Sulfotelmatobacter sp.]
MRRRIAHGLAIAFLIVGLGAAQGPTNSEAKPAPSSSSVQGNPEVRQQVNKTKPFQVGTASWYGESFEGKPTASGEPYDMYDMTAAHLTLPIGSYVKVTNLHNGKAVVVRVNDRGPVVPGRIIDLSYGAAQALQFRHRGLQRVRLDVIQAGQHKAASAYQTVAFNHPPVAQLP